MALRSIASRNVKITSSLRFVRNLETPGILPAAAVPVDKTKDPKDQLAESLNAVRVLFRELLCLRLEV